MTRKKERTRLRPKADSRRGATSTHAAILLGIVIVAAGVITYVGLTAVTPHGTPGKVSTGNPPPTCYPPHSVHCPPTSSAVVAPGAPPIR